LDVLSAFRLVYQTLLHRIKRVPFVVNSRGPKQRKKYGMEKYADIFMERDVSLCRVVLLLSWAGRLFWWIWLLFWNELKGQRIIWWCYEIFWRHIRAATWYKCFYFGDI
jgi:hypothetical protein